MGDAGIFLLGLLCGGGLVWFWARTRERTALVERTHLQARLAEQKTYFESLEARATTTFENLAFKLLEENSRKTQEKTKTDLGLILDPLKERIKTFEKRVEDTYTTESKERHALKFEVGRLILLNEKMSLEAHHLTQALRGDSKVQGDWGEFTLEKLLEDAGLREGIEFSTQEELQNDSGESYRPDVIINLPEGKRLVVDSKVSLKNYIECIEAQDDALRGAATDALVKSVNRHIDGLGDKHYSRLKGVHSPEVVFLFIPIETAYLLVMQKDREIASRAWRKNIAIVTPSTLFASLKTVASLWRLENQNRNAQKIAHEGARMYDKFVGFLEDFEKIGKLFESGHALHGVALSKLKDGKGSVFRKMEQLRELGAAPAKRIAEEHLDREQGELGEEQGKEPSKEIEPDRPLA